jgi:hypothetical protein
MEEGGEGMFQFVSQTSRDSVAALLKYSVDAEFFDHMIQKYPRQTVLLLDNEKLVGIGVFWQHPNHPDAIYFRMTASYDTQNRDLVYHHLFDEIEKSAFSQFDAHLMIFVTWQTQRDLIKFGAESGFRAYKYSFKPEIATESFLGIDFDIPTYHRVMSLEELKQNPKFLADFLVYFEENYETDHSENPVRELSQEEWVNLLFGAEPLTDVPAVLIKNEKVAAYAVSYEIDSKTVQYEWFGSVDKDYQSLFELVARLSQTLELVGYEKIIAEMDTADENAMHVLGTFPFKPSPSLVYFKKQYVDPEPYLEPESGIRGLINNLRETAAAETGTAEQESEESQHD